MKKFLKHLLLPFTALLWYFACYYTTWIVIAALVYVFDFYWLWLLFIWVVLIGLVSAIFTLPSLLNHYLLNKLYGYSWASVLTHCVMGLLGFFSTLNVLRDRGIDLGVFWSVSPFKTILLLIPALGIIVGMFYSVGVSPILIKKR